MNSTAPQTTEIDGRRRRSQDSRARIVRAMLELVQGGVVAPSAEQVAGRADVGLRTVFRHFTDMESLYREISAVVEGEMYKIIGEPLEAADWRGKVQEIIGRRATLYERIYPFKHAADVTRHVSPFLQEDHERMVVICREILRSILPEALPRERFEAADLMLSFEAWERLRVDQGLSFEEAEAVLRETLTALLG